MYTKYHMHSTEELNLFSTMTADEQYTWCLNNWALTCLAEFKKCADSQKKTWLSLEIALMLRKGAQGNDQLIQAAKYCLSATLVQWSDWTHTRNAHMGDKELSSWRSLTHYVKSI